MNREDSILIEEAAIRAKVAELGEQINRDYKDRELIMIAIANGAVVFAADLLRCLRLTVWFDTVKASSYRGTVSGDLALKNTFNLDLSNRHILLVDDILDTSKTLCRIREHILSFSPASLRTCVLLDKPSGRSNGFRADYCGFLIPDRFVFGYGLDDDRGLGRNFPWIAARD